MIRGLSGAALLAWSCLIGIATGSATAQSFYSPDIARPDMALARIKPGSRVYFYRGDDLSGCPALTARCRSRAYLVAGDLVLVGKPGSTLTEAAFADGAGHVTIGWLPIRSFEPIPIPVATPTDWHGAWSGDEAQIDIAPGRQPGRLEVSGNATWGSHDPARVRSGGINFGDFSGDAQPAGGSMTVVDKEEPDCRVSMRLIGPYLIANDAMKCGGLNVTFSGIYRR